ncbi:MAG: dephospho-CoA kinase [bacterium]|nr:dephospho-CoA kinase [bacterium]
MIIGVTGIAGSGKSTLKKILEKYDYIVFDVDDFVKDIYKKRVYKKIREQIAKLFPECTKTTSKRVFINKKCIKNIIFNDQNRRKDLENIIHPIVIKKIEKIVKKYSKKSQNKKVFIIVPLLYEANLEYLFDEVWLVYVPIYMAVDRLVNRDKISYELALNIINSQQPQTIKAKKANKIIINDSTIQELEKQIINLL